MPEILSIAISKETTRGTQGLSIIEGTVADTFTLTLIGKIYLTVMFGNCFLRVQQARGAH